ncbi:hypothetical protein EDC01DRAFT_638271 [Geopyxis carbonaria]|nr:hypothetical protein EDC01DRAFT_638271 [Geopyxis carbonaria]
MALAPVLVPVLLVLVPIHAPGYPTLHHRQGRVRAWPGCGRLRECVGTWVRSMYIVTAPGAVMLCGGWAHVHVCTLHRCCCCFGVASRSGRERERDLEARTVAPDRAALCTTPPTPTPTPRTTIRLSLSLPPFSALVYTRPRSAQALPMTMTTMMMMVMVMVMAVD